jgi:molybdopterin converting factor small subunit
MITVRLPATLRIGAEDTLAVQEPVATVEDLIDVLDRRIPGFRAQLDDSVFNFAVNDEMLLYRARDRRLQEGDTVEIIPTISGGSRSSRARARATCAARARARGA